MPPQAPANPPYVKVLTASVQPGQVLAGQPVSIMANVKNSGDLSGSYTAELTINGELEAGKKVSVPGNASTPVQFSVVRDEPGTYTSDIGGQTAYFTVVEAAGQSGNNTGIYVILGVLVLVAAALGYLFLRKR